MTSRFEAQTTIRMELILTEMEKIAGRVGFGGGWVGVNLKLSLEHIKLEMPSRYLSGDFE